VENGGHCKAGGLRHNIGRCLDDGHILHADNPHPRFFDISNVFRPADRIAYISGTMSKAANAGVVSGAELAEQMGVTAPIGIDANTAISAGVQNQLIALQKLAEAELLPNNAALYTQMALAQNAAVQDTIALPAGSEIKLAEAFRALADAGVVLPLNDFLTLTVKSANVELVKSVAAALPGIFSKMAAEGDIVSTLEQNAYNPAYAGSVRMRMWAEKIAATKSMLPKEIEKRAYLAVLRNVQVTAVDDTNLQTMTKHAEASSPAVKTLAHHYALYKIAAVSEFMKKYNVDGLTAQYCVMQNYVM
jgi:hypothetical protein